MRINTFYTAVLGSGLRNGRWSWGSFDPVMNRVYLRVWEDQFRVVDGDEYVLVLRPSPRRQSPGYAEREAHLELIEAGAEGYGVVCTAKDPLTDGARAIKHFDPNTLLEFGPLVDFADGRYARVRGRVSANDLGRRQTSTTTLSGDLKAILRQRLKPTEKEVLLSARVGQGQFRSQVLRLWDGRCAVTGITVLEVIRASHIKPWRSSTNQERLNPYNGLPLAATYDALFDAGLIAVDGSGTVMVSDRLGIADRTALALESHALIAQPPEETREFLSYHRTHLFR
jgi:putative restriction endonuclease